MLSFPLHVPDVAVSVSARRAVPDTTGETVLTGPAAVTVAVGLLVWLALPSALVAVTSTRTVAPTSATVSTYVAPVAPAMLTQFGALRALPLEARAVADARPRAGARGELQAALRGPGHGRPHGVHRRGARDGDVAVLSAAALPSGLEAVTSRRTVAPTSAAVSS